MSVDFLFLAAGGGIVDSAVNTAREFGADWPKLIAQIINFLLIAFCLHRFAFRPLLVTLDQRKHRIKESLENADRVKAELAQAEASRKEILAKANSEADRMIAEARAVAARVQEAETQKAVAQAEQIIAKAKDAAVLERERMLAELKREVGRLVVDTTSKVTGKVLTMEDQRKLIDETSKQVAA